MLEIALTLNQKYSSCDRREIHRQTNRLLPFYGRIQTISNARTTPICLEVEITQAYVELRRRLGTNGKKHCALVRITASG